MRLNETFIVCAMLAVSASTVGVTIFKIRSGGVPAVGAPAAPPKLSKWKSSQVVQGAHLLKGQPGATYTLVEFFDYQCPACRFQYDAHRQIVERLPKGTAFAVHNYPLPMHSRAVPAAMLALAAERKGKVADAHRMLMAHDASLDDQGLRKIAATLGVKDSELVEPGLRASVLKEEKQAEQLGIMATPTFVLCDSKGRAWMLSTPEQANDMILTGT